MPSPTDRERLATEARRAAILGVLVVALGGGVAAKDNRLPGFSLGGTTGLVNVPTAEILPDGVVRAGFAVVDRKWAVVGRGEMSNEIYFLSLGFLPRTETTVRATVLPEIELLEGRDAPAVDRMASFRVQLVKGGHGPCVSVGVDDVRGTRRYHALYIVGTQSFRDPLRVRLTGGYGSTALDAQNHTLDGPFGGAEIELWNGMRSGASIMIDSDTEKVNAGARITLFDRVSLHLALLHLETLSGGIGWTKHL